MMMTGWTKDSSRTYERNPDYWGYDEKYPENRLPYIDRLRGLVRWSPESTCFSPLGWW